MSMRDATNAELAQLIRNQVATLNETVAVANGRELIVQFELLKPRLIDISPAIRVNILTEVA